MNKNSKTGKRGISLKMGGFTMAEMLVVVGIVTVLSTASIVGVINVSRRAQYERARKDIQDIIGAIELARINSGNRLRTITGTTCSYCQCRLSNGATDTATDTQCWDNYVAAIDDINDRAGTEVIHGYPRDPWGSPYLINENEGEAFGGCTDTDGDGTACCSDIVGSAGPDRQTLDSPGGDDITRNFQPLCRPIEGIHHPDGN